MSAQHTPGPWEANGPFVNSGAVTGIADCSRAEIAENWAGSDYSTEVHAEANARLIAAAPELLKALIGVCRSYDRVMRPGAPMPDSLKYAEAVIDMATGRAA